MKKRILGYLLMASAVAVAVAPSLHPESPEVNNVMAVFLVFAGWVMLRLASREARQETEQV